MPVIANISIREPLSWWECSTRLLGEFLESSESAMQALGKTPKLIMERVGLQQTLYIAPIVGVGIPIMIGCNIARSRPLHCRDFAKGFALSCALTVIFWAAGLCLETGRMNLLCSHLYQIPIDMSQRPHS